MSAVIILSTHASTECPIPNHKVLASGRFLPPN